MLSHQKNRQIEVVGEMQLELLLRARIILIWILKKRITEGIAKNAQAQICFPVSGFLTLLKGDR